MARIPGAKIALRNQRKNGNPPDRSGGFPVLVVSFPFYT